MKKYLPFLIVGVVALATLVSAAVLYRIKRPATLANMPGQSEATGVRPTLGPENAAVVLEEFGDFQCPPCGALAEPLNQIVRDYQPNVRLVFREFPLPVHSHAKEAAIAAEAAGAQGKFWQMHDVLYREQSMWAKATDVHSLFDSYARLAGLDLDRFKKDIASAEIQKRVENDRAAGSSLGVQNTPTIFLNERPVEPKSLNPAALRAAVDAAVKSQRHS